MITFARFSLRQFPNDEDIVEPNRSVPIIPILFRLVIPKLCFLFVYFCALLSVAINDFATNEGGKVVEMGKARASCYVDTSRLKINV